MFDPVEKAPIIPPLLGSADELDEGWLKTRLTPGGPLAIIDRLRDAGEQCKTVELREAMAEARSHGQRFLRSLDTTPVDLSACLGRTPVDGNIERRSSLGCFLQQRGSSCGVWSWAVARLDELEKVESQLAATVAAVTDAISSAQWATPALSCDPSRKRATSKEAPAKRPSQLTTLPEDESVPAEVPRTWMGTPLLKKATQTMEAASGVDEMADAQAFLDAHEGLMVASRRLKALRSANVLTLTNGLNREVEGYLQTLEEAKFKLFDRFVQWLKPLEQDMETAAAGSSKEFLEKTIHAACRTVAAHSLMGNAGMMAANIVGLGINPEAGECEPPDPWDIDLRIPPWQAVVIAACTRLAQLRGVSEECATLSTSRRMYDRYSFA